MLLDKIWPKNTLCKDITAALAAKKMNPLFVMVCLANWIAFCKEHQHKWMRSENWIAFCNSCSQSPVSYLVAKFGREIKSSIAKQPTRSIHDQFTVLRDEFTCEMSEDMKIAFIQELPNLQQICPRLYNFRKTFIHSTRKFRILKQKTLVQTLTLKSLNHQKNSRWLKRMAMPWLRTDI
jgi:hypothetical protein